MRFVAFDWVTPDGYRCTRCAEELPGWTVRTEHAEPVPSGLRVIVTVECWCCGEKCRVDMVKKGNSPEGG